ncbi:MAG TPA: molybdenum cofactor guanylyltransferase [Blastocatellia bacterium]|nr:molybdenum cofactor guanylyltransferase [Blastocatellia bacterium]
MVSGFVTAGGRSSRMGRDKAWLELDGQTMIERVITAIKPVTTDVSVIANSAEYNRLGLPVYADTHTGIGPLEAIRTALANASTSRVLLVGCDLPFVTAELFSFLLSLKGDYQAIVPVGADDRLEPICAIYSTDALSEVTRLIESGARKVSLLFERIRTRLVIFDEIRHLQGADLFFENVNTQEEYSRALEVLHKLRSQ